MLIEVQIRQQYQQSIHKTNKTSVNNVNNVKTQISNFGICNVGVESGVCHYNFFSFTIKAESFNAGKESSFSLSLSRFS